MTIKVTWECGVCGNILTLRHNDHMGVICKCGEHMRKVKK